MIGCVTVVESFAELKSIVSDGQTRRKVKGASGQLVLAER